MGSLEEGAINAVKTCMGVNNSDRVMIVTDLEAKEVAEALHDVSQSITEIRKFVLESYASRPMTRLPTEIIKAIPDSTVTFWIAQSYEGELEVRSFFRAEALKHARHAHMPGVTKAIMEQGMCVDYNLIHEITMKVYQTVKDLNSVKVSSTDGTALDLTFNKNWKWVPSHGIFKEKGMWGNLPDGEVFTAPYNANGKIVISELGDWFAKKYGYLQETVSLEIKNSRVVLDSIHCDNPELKKEFLQYLKIDENSNRASEFSIPTNLSLMKMPLVGNMLQDEKARVHIAFGDPYGSQTNADWKSTTHVDCILGKCDITTDCAEIMKSGRLLID
ncbi:MAG: aminopeptidase [Nitrososphaerales archaeon]